VADVVSTEPPEQAALTSAGSKSNANSFDDDKPMVQPILDACTWLRLPLHLGEQSTSTCEHLKTHFNVFQYAPERLAKASISQVVQTLAHMRPARL